MLAVLHPQAKTVARTGKNMIPRREVRPTDGDG